MKKTTKKRSSAKAAATPEKKEVAKFTVVITEFNDGSQTVSATGGANTLRTPYAILQVALEMLGKECGLTVSKTKTNIK